MLIIKFNRLTPEPSIRRILTLNIKIMGWTSYQYTIETHLNWNLELAKEFVFSEFNTYGYSIIELHFHKSKTALEHHEIYLVMKHPEEYNFLMVVLVSINNKEIYFKEIPISMGPVYYNCPTRLLDFLPEPKTDFEAKWREKILNN